MQLPRQIQYGLQWYEINCVYEDLDSPTKILVFDENNFCSIHGWVL